MHVHLLQKGARKKMDSNSHCTSPYLLTYVVHTHLVDISI